MRPPPPLPYKTADNTSAIAAANDLCDRVVHGMPVRLAASVWLSLLNRTEAAAGREQQVPIAHTSTGSKKGDSTAAATQTGAEQ